jgi:hypothetical protein
MKSSNREFKLVGKLSKNVRAEKSLSEKMTIP